MDGVVKDPESGIAMRFVKQFDITMDRKPSKFDVFMAISDDDLSAAFGVPTYPSYLDC